MDKISKSQVKMVRSLQQKKFRDELGLFVAEGEKCVSELLKSFNPELIIVSAEKGISPILNPSSPFQGGTEGGLVIASPTEIEQMSSLRTPQGVIGVFQKRPLTHSSTHPLTHFERGAGGVLLALDGIQDPGNLGTIIRTCDWFGVHDIVCSQDTADCYNPKVVQATMGALARVRVHYVNLPAWLQSKMSIEGGLRIFGTLLEGKNMYDVLADLSSLSPSLGGIEGGFFSIIVMGNEGNGISPAVRSLVTHPIRIPSFPENAETSESLNVSIATAIVLAEFRRMMHP